MPKSILPKLLRDHEQQIPPIDARVRHVTIDSPSLGVTKKFYVALPPGYSSASNANRRYPVLYLFRGHEREWVHRWQDKSRHGRTVIDVYRDLLDAGKVGPMILVFPGISSDDNRIPGLLVNFLNPAAVSQVPGIGTGRFHDYFIDDLVPYVDANYRTVASRDGRAVEGFSLGGFQSIKIAAEHPDMFCSAGSFDGTFLYATEKGKSIRLNDRVVRNPMFAPAFGTPPEPNHIAASNPANLLWRGDKMALEKVQWMVRSGPESGEPWQANYFRAQHVIRILADRGLENSIGGVLKGAIHSWSWADKHVSGTLPLHWQALAKGAAGGEQSSSTALPA
ncbi:MAG TPA: alpha/beta hydrolase-fold protein [Chloroflexia bacterium]|nr:alpha/beta hydrolase-fold protein [Chloroflexia bacterium]